jgi:hypothetical protein
VRTEKAGELIQLAREDIGMTQAELARAAGMQQPTVSAYESGSKRPRPDTLTRILLAARARPSVPLMVYADEIRSAARDFHLSRVRVFGSSVRGDDTEVSDIDLLVHADDAATLYDLAGFTDAVREITGFEVDVLTESQAESPHFAHIARGAVAL